MKRKCLLSVLSLCMIFGTYSPLTVTAGEAEGFASSVVVENSDIDDGFVDSYEENEIFTDEISTFDDENAGENTTSDSNKYVSVNDYIEYMYEEDSKTLYFRLKDGVTSAEMPNNATKAAGVWAVNHASDVECINIGDGITSIGDNNFAFYKSGNIIYYGNLKKVVLPTTVTSIGINAFCEVSTLTDINISDVKKIGMSAFNGTGLTSLSFSTDSETVLGSSAFKNCKNLQSVEAGNIVFAMDAFAGCTSLKSVTVKNASLENAGGVFQNCNLLSEFKCDNKLESIPMAAFANTAISEFDFSTIKSLASRAFAGTPLVSVSLNKDVVFSGKRVFQNCTQLSNICYDGTQEEWNATGATNASKQHLPSGVVVHCKAEETPVFATCTTAGKAKLICPVCNGEFTDGTESEALGHEFASNYTVDKEATCTEEGEKSKHCERDGCNARDDIEKIDALGHDYVETTVAPTCTEKGTLTRTCSRCNDVVTEEIPALGHDFAKDYTVDVKATCTTDGKQSKHCSRCDAKTDEQKIPALGHDFTSKVTKEATCTADGVITKTCSRCDATETEAIKATGHKFGDWKVTAEATVFAPEQQERICETCGIKETKAEGTALKATATVNASTVKLKVKQSTSGLKVTSLAMGDSVKTWKSTNTKIFTVKGKANGTCKLTAKKAGTAKLQITLASGLKKTVTVKVQKSNVKTTKVSVSNKNVSVKKGKKVTLKPVVTPFTSKQKVTYTSSNKKVATVSAKGVVTGKKKGTAKITIKSGSKSVKVTVRVK